MAASKSVGRKKIDPRAYDVAKRIYDRRIELGLSCYESAVQLGVKESNYRSWEVQFGDSREKKYLTTLSKVFMKHPRWFSYGESPSDCAAYDDNLSRKDVVISKVDLQSMALRAQDRRKDISLSVNKASISIGIDIGTMLRWERVFPRIIDVDAQSKWESFLSVPPGWLKDLTMEAPDIFSSFYGPVSASEPISVSEEIRLIGCWLSGSKITKRTTEFDELSESEKRSANMFAARFGVKGEYATILQSIGDDYNLTRERVRQILEKMTERAVNLKMATPNLDKLAMDIVGDLPCLLSELDSKYKELMGENLSIVSIDRFSREILGRKLLDIAESPIGAAISGNSVAVNPDTHRPEFYKAIRESSHRMIRSCGAAQIDFVVGDASRTVEGLSISAAKRILLSAPGFQWILENDGWYWFGPQIPLENRLLSVAKKVIAVAGRKMDVEDILQAVIRSRRSYYEAELTRPPSLEPSMNVAVSVLSKTPWLKVVQSDDFELTAPVNIEELLSEGEFKVYEFLRSTNGVSSRYNISKYLIDEMGMNKITLAVVLDSSPVLSRLDTGVFALRGWPVDANSIQIALDSVWGGCTNDFNLSIEDDGCINFQITLNEYHINTRVFGIPAGAAAHLVNNDALIMAGFDEPVMFRSYSYVSGNYCRLNQFIHKLIKLKYLLGDLVQVKINPKLKTIEVSKIKGEN